MTLGLLPRPADDGPLGPNADASDALRVMARGWIAITPLLLGACAVGPDYRPPTPAAPAHWTSVEASDATATHSRSPAPRHDWWRKLGDPLLPTLIEVALLANGDVRTATARLREARARSEANGGTYYPTLAASGSASRRQTVDTTGSGAASHQLSAGFDASWEIDVFGGTRRSVEAAEADRDSAEASFDEAQVSLIAEVAHTYFEVRSLQIRLALGRDNLISQSETVELTELRARAGLVNAQDVEQARSNREQTRAQLPSLESTLAQAEHRLDVLLGKNPGTLHAQLASGGELPWLPAQVAVGIPAETLRQRPDVRVAERKLAAATARVGVAEAAKYPAFKLSGSIGIEALTQTASSSGLGFLYSLLGGMTAPIFQGGRLRAQAEAQDAVREQALVAYEQSVLSALEEVENALVALAASRDRAAALARAAESARNAAEMARQRYSAGMIDFQSVLDTQRSVFAVEDGLAGTRADGVFALIRLYKALGGGWAGESAKSAAEEDSP